MRTITLLLVIASLALAGGADEARALLGKGDAKGAIAAARKAVAADPADIEAWLVLADAYFAQDEPADAWTDLEKAIAKNPAEARLSLKLGDAFVKLAEKEQRTSGDGTTITNYYLDAERNYAEALEKDPKSTDALFGMASVNFWLGRDESKQKARKLLADCLAIDKDYAKAHALQAYMLYLDGAALAQNGDEDAAKEKYRAAQEKYELALRLDDSDVIDHVRYGHTLYGQGKAEEAKKAYLAGLKRHPGSDVPIRSGLYHVANLGQERASWTNLKPLLEEAVKAVPDSAPAWYYLGYCHSADEEWSDALKAYGKALAIAPKNPTYIFYVGYMHEKLGDTAKALDAYRKTLAAVPDHADATTRFYQIAIVNAGDIDRVEKLLEELVALSPNTGWLHNDYALILRNWAEATRTATERTPPAAVKRRLKRSAEVYEISARLEPDTAQIQSDTGLLFEFYPCIFDAEKAKRYFTRALDLSDYAYRDAFDGLDRLCRKTGDWATLEDYAERVIGSMERGNQAIAPVGGRPPEALPNETPGLKARATAAYNAARSKLKDRPG